jgi:hypothetical protein
MTKKDKCTDIPQDKAISEALDREGGIYRKSGDYHATRVTVVTPVETVLESGITETRNTAQPGDYIVTGIGGERYVVKPEVFEARYELKPGYANVYCARGYVKGIRNPFNRTLHICAPWGEVQNGEPDCMVVDIYDPATRTRDGKPYIINRAEFAKSYVHVAGPAARAPSTSKAAWYMKK